MSINIRASSTRDWFKRLAARAGKLWFWLKERRRQNPGFAAAAAAGIIGLGLAIGPLIDAGRIWLSGSDQVVESADDDDAAALGAPVSFAPAEFDRETDDPFADSMMTSGRAPHRTNDDADDAADDPDEEPAEMVTRATPIRKRIILDVEDDEINDEPADADGEKSKQPLALPIEVAEREAMDEVGDEADEDREPEPAPAPPGVRDSEIEPAGAIADGPKADEIPSESPGWKQPPPKLLAETAPPAKTARQSQPSETVVVATPQRKTGAQRAADSGGKSDAPPLRLEIAGPREAGPEQMCAYEIRIRNLSRAPARQLTLTVNLPDGLSHEMGPTPIQRIDTIAPGQTYRALLRVRITGRGRQSFSADVSTESGTSVQSTTAVDVDDLAPARPAKSAALPECCAPARR